MIAKRYGGFQRIEIGNDAIDWEFMDTEKLLPFKMGKKPTINEVNQLPINWVTPRIPVDSTEFLKQSSRPGRGMIESENPHQLGVSPQ